MREWGQKFYANLGKSYVDLAMIGANYAPDADPVFFINGPS